MQKYQTCSVVGLARAWNTLVFSRSRNRSKSQEWMPKVLTDEPNCRIWLSAKHQTYSRIKSDTAIFCTIMKISETVCLSVCFQKVTWEKLHKNLLQELNQQASGLLLVFTQLESL